MQEMRQEDALRLWTYVGLTAALVVAYSVMENVDWQYGNTQLHTVMEVVATLLALIVGVVALVRYYARRHDTVLLLGVGFIGTALLDGYHAIVTSSAIQPYLPSEAGFLIPWSWNASRTFLALLMFLSWLTWHRQRKLGSVGKISDFAVYMGVGGLTLICFFVFAFVPLGDAYSPDSAFGRPEEFVAAALFAVSLGGYLAKRTWLHDSLDYWIVGSLIVGFFCQALFMSRSFSLFDGMFDMAHLLKIVSYALVLVGLLADISAMWRRDQHMSFEKEAALARTNAELEFAHVTAASDTNAQSEKSAIVRETGDELVGIGSFDDLLDLWAQQARMIIGAHQSAVSYMPSRNFADGKHAISMSEKYDRYKTYNVLPTGEGIWSLIVHQKLSFCLTHAELTAHPSWKNFSDMLDDRGLEHPPMRGWLAVPILGRSQEFVGVLQLTDKYEGDFNDRDLASLTRLGRLMAPAFGLQFTNEIVQQRSAELAANAKTLEEQRLTAVALAEELKQADRAKNEFLANMSHEIRTPMNAVIGLTELVLQSNLDDVQRDYLSTVMASADSLLSVINDILDFSKIEAGMLQFEQVDFQLQDAVGDAVRSQAVRAQRKELELICFIDPTIPGTLRGDPGRVRQVLINLVGNAIKFTDVGEVVVKVDRGDDENGQLQLTFSVRDTGIGIPQDKFESIFRPFEQADMSTTREFGGTGLGLAICDKLVSLMGGQIAVESDLGQGSTFRFTAEFEVADKQPQSTSIPAELKGTRVLVVDDNATNRTILEQVLLAKEMAPVTAPSALDGFALLQESHREGRPFRLLISDVHMPNVDGFGLATMIRADDQLAELDIILLTSSSRPGDQQRCADLGISAQLSKPAKQSELYNVVMRVLGLDAEDGNGWLSMQEPVDGDLRPLRVLLVEDSIANQKVALAVLSRAGHTAVVANHGQEALSILEVQKFDVILMDVQMPVMDGLETTAAIRAAEGIHEHQPIVAMTAHAMTGDRERCLDAGMDEYVSKPIHQASLFRAIATAVGLNLIDSSTSNVFISAAKKQLVDWTGPLAQLRGDRTVLKEITQLYMDETQTNLARLPQCIEEGNVRDTQRLAHTVKGAMRFFSAEVATQCGQELEDLAETADMESATQLAEKLKSEVDRVLPILQRFIDTGEM